MRYSLVLITSVSKKITREEIEALSEYVNSL